MIQLFIGSSLIRRGIVDERLVDLDDRTRYGRIEVGCGLDAFDSAEVLAFGHVVVGFGHVDIDNVAELAGCEFRDADCGCVALDAGIFVGGKIVSMVL